MTDYNDGKWHGWNGGECPVDPDSLIVCAYRSCSTDATGQYAGMGTRAGLAPWSDVIAFRVTKPAPPKQREWWAVGLHLHKSEADAQAFLAELNARHPDMDFGPITHVREVLPD
jgi:hypothetical protein